jgi:hypothetical protein
MSQEGFERLDTAVEQLTLNDGSISVTKEASAALGQGFRCGFLGMLHMDVFMQRLMQEHGEEVASCTAPIHCWPRCPNCGILPLVACIRCLRACAAMPCSHMQSRLHIYSKATVLFSGANDAAHGAVSAGV